MANNDILKSKELIENFNKVWDEHSKFINKANNSLEAFVNNAKVPSTYVNALKQVNDNNKGLAESYAKVNTAQEKLSTSQKKLEQERLRELRLATKREKAFDKMDAKLKREERQAQRNAAAETKLASAYNQLNAKLAKAEQEYRDLAASQGLNSKATIKQQQAVQKLRGQIDAINTPIKRFNNNVGNYRSALGGAGKALRGFIGAFGLIGGVYLFAAAVKDTFKRIREFDKAMQNIAGIMRVSRGDIKDLEIEIKRVAGTSVKTSREVAELAENLVTLGKTKTEIKQLLEPVNNLAIGLETTSGEAAEFLVQTLNAFGAGADEAEEYADVIATIRTSTSLDFQKMRDSFQYLTPISKILNKDLAYTGSVLGILADNGLRAESAGRLLATAQQKLSKSGKTLQYALDKVNNAQKNGVKETELLALASKLFGVQAAKVGIILAQNSDKLEENAQAIRDNGGALDDLVNKQLESMDAKLKILDSTWEEFVLSISSGSGAIGDAFKFIVESMTQAVKGMISLSQGFESAQRAITSSEVSKNLSKSKPELETAQKQLESYRRAIRITEAELADAEDSIFSTRWERDEIKKNLGFLKGNADAYREYIKLLKQAKEIEKPLNDDDDDGSGDGGNKSIEKRAKEIDLITIAASETETYRQTIEKYLGVAKKLRDEQLEGSHQWEVYNNQVEYYNKLLDGTIKANEDWLDAQNAKIAGIKAEEERIRLLKEATQEYLKTFNEGFLSDAGIGSLGIFLDGTFDKLLEGVEPMTEKFKVAFAAISEVGQEAFNLISQASQKNFEAEYSRLEEQKEFSINNAGDSAAAKEEIEKQYEARRKQIARRQAEAEKKQAQFNIAINTAQAIVSALPNIPLSIAIGVIGAAQLAAVSAQQIPQFWEGGVYNGGSNGQIMVNDDPYGKKGSNYKEVIQKPNGDILKPQGKNVKMRVPKGTIIHPTYDAFENSLNDLMVNTGIAPFNNSRAIVPVINNNGISKAELNEVMDAHAQKVVRSLSNKEGYELNFDEKGFSKFITKGNTKKEILNSRRLGRGFNV
jgi:hypothetical protein